MLLSGDRPAILPAVLPAVLPLPRAQARLCHVPMPACPLTCPSPPPPPPGNYDTYVQTRSEQDENQMKKFKWEQVRTAPLLPCYVAHLQNNKSFEYIAESNYVGRMGAG